LGGKVLKAFAFLRRLAEHASGISFMMPNGTWPAKSFKLSPFNPGTESSTAVCKHDAPPD